VPVGLPYNLTWTAGEDGLVDANGVGTGFTMADPPSNRLLEDGAPGNPRMPGYEPANLTVDTAAGALTITTNLGIQFRAVNALVNALGVGVNAGTQPLTIDTTVMNPDIPAPGAQQGGLWFGLDEDNYVKLVLVKASGPNMRNIQLLQEVGGETTEVNLPAPIALETGATVRLIMATNPATTTVSGSYQINDGPVTALPAGFSDVPASFFTGTSLADGTGPVSFAGIFATHRNSNAPLNFSFEEFRVQ
jgi:hypothetical protein